MVKKSILLIALCVFSTVRAPQASAHVLLIDGSIGAVLHIDPEDDPIAGQQSAFFFEFKDKQGKFKPEQCDCTFSILRHDSVIFSQSLFQNNTNPSLQDASIFFTFPQRDVYQVKVTGTPTTPQAFQPFTLIYDVRVSRITQDTSGHSGNALVSISRLVALALAVMLVFILLFFIKKRKARHHE